MIKHKLHIDRVSYTEKPTVEEIRKKGTGINDRITRNIAEVEIEELAQAVSNGQTWIASHVKGSRNNENVLDQSVFALDFDNTQFLTDSKTGKKLKVQVDSPIRFQQVLARLREYGLDCCFAYSTFSHTDEWHKFRVVFQLEKAVTGRGQRQGIQNALLMLFPEADKCRDACRLWHGTNKGLIYENYNYFLNVPILKESGVFYSASKGDSSNTSRKIKSSLQKLKSDEKWVNPLYIKENTHNSSEINNSKITNPETYHYFLEGSKHSDIYAEILDKGYLDNVNFEELASRVRVLADFMNPEVKLDHQTLKGLATNLYRIKGGQALFRDCINANPNYDKAKLTLMSYCREVEYIPMSLESFSPYEKDWEYINMLQAARLPRGGIIRKEKYKPVTLEEGELMLDRVIDEALIDEGVSIWVIKKATGLGGTRKLLSLEGVTIAFPNHDLKEEVAKDFKAPYISTPKLPLDTLSEALREKIEYLHEVGAIDRVYSLLREEAVGNPALVNYIDESIKAYRASKTVLTTHSKALFIDFEYHNTVIFDEDPLPCILEIGEVSLNDLNDLACLVSNPNDQRKFAKYADILMSNMEDCVESTKSFVFDDIDSVEELILKRGNFRSNILKFIGSQYYARDSQYPSSLQFLKHNSLNSNALVHKKIIIISATANEFIYKQLYRGRVRFVDISNVEMKGIVVQDTQYSYSRSSLAQASVREQVKKQLTDFQHLITFKPYRQYFSMSSKDGENLYYGKCAGSNELAGKKIAVIGTPHLRTIHYLLYAKALGIEVCPQDFRLWLLRVHHNGFEFRLRTFVKPQLQIIQFHFIEEQMIQAIGRARLLRIPEEAMLFSNYPLPFSLIAEDEIAQGREKLAERKQAYFEQCLKTSRIISLEQDIGFENAVDNIIYCPEEFEVIEM